MSENAIRKSPRTPKQTSFFSPETEQSLNSPSKREGSPSKSPKKNSPKNANKKIVGGKHKYSSMVKRAMIDMGRESAHSFPAIIKYIQSNFQLDKDEATLKRYVKLSLHRGPFTKIRASYKLKTKKPARYNYVMTEIHSRRKPKKAVGPAKKEEQEEKEEVKKSPSPRKRKAASEEKTEEKTEEKKKRSPRKKKEEEEKESPKKKRSPKKKEEEKESPKKKRSPKKKEEEEKNEDENGNNSNNNNNKKAKRTPKKTALPKDKEIVVPDVLPDVTTTGIVFNTTDLPEVRADIKQTIDSLLTDDDVRVGIVANRGWKDGGYNLELLEFTEDSKKIQDFVENSFGEGRDWLSYYKQVLQDCVNFGWGVNKSKTLILIGDEGVNAVRDPSLQTEIGKLTQLGVRVFAFHHSQLFLLPSVLSNLN